jgi:hypothetical protein
LATQPSQEDARQIDFADGEQEDEVDRVSCHCREGVEGDYLALSCEGIDNGGIPRIDVAQDVLQENQRPSGRLAEAAMGKADLRPSM